VAVSLWVFTIYDAGVSYGMSKIVLASASPRRAELLAQIGVQFEVYAADIDETPMTNESPYDYVVRMALEKARAVANCYDDKIILASDTSVVFEGDILGKPEDEQHARNMLQRLSGKTHQVMTSICLLGEQQHLVVSTTDVTFRDLSEREISAYWASGEPLGKAGGYAIQGFGATFIERIAGSYSAVMGLPLFEVGQALRAEGVITA